MKNIIIIIVIVLLVIYISYEYIRVQKTIKLSQGIVAQTIAFQNISKDTSVTLLVLGDSTAVGVGSDIPSSTVPALVAGYLGATYTENLAVSGAVVQDLPGQLNKAKLSKYDFILVQIGGNNIVARQDPKVVSSILEKFYKRLPESKQVLHVCCGNVGTTTILPWFVRSYYTNKTLAYHRAFEAIDSANNVIYINLYEPKKVDPFVKNPEIYLAADGFHPSNTGYEYWFSRIKTKIIK